MTASRVIKKKNAVIAVTANADVLFMPGGQVYGWTRRLANQDQKSTELFAPRHNRGLRPLRPHPVKPLHKTFSTTPARFIRWARGPRVYVAVGSSSHYAKFVDQGTGVYNGGSPWAARILPPFAQGEPSLYEASWVPIGSTGGQVDPVMVKGQRGQHFFDAGLRSGLAIMRVPSYQRPGDPEATEALRTWPTELEGYFGAVPVAAGGTALEARLVQWRRWRDVRYGSHEELGRGAVPGLYWKWSPRRLDSGAVGRADRRKYGRTFGY